MSKPLFVSRALAAAVGVLLSFTAQAAPQILINHLGYEAAGSKKIVVEGTDAPAKFQIVDARGAVAYEGPLGAGQKVDHWTPGPFARGDFSTLQKPGIYRVRLTTPSGVTESPPFPVGAQVLADCCLNDLLSYFKSQRSSGLYDATDRKLPVFGEKRKVDVHGGWYDASGDVSKYLTHLSYANFMNPQQTPMVVWNLLQTADLLVASKSKRMGYIMPLLREEAIYGADFLVRMQDPKGYFYATVFDVWSHEASKREICAYKTQEGYKNGDYQAAFREGGGVAIAALARASTLKMTGDFPPARYLATAEKGFAHLQAHNLEYDDNHEENIIDDYAALLAASELYAATKKPAYLTAARARAQSLMRRLSHDDKYKGFWRADKADRPFFHAADAGLPDLALLRYRSVESDGAAKAAALQAVQDSLAFEMFVTAEVANPFGLARQYVKDLGGGKRTAFFYPHKNESGYWWQGENARLGSLAAAATLTARELPADKAKEKAALRRYAVDQLDWIFGLNPYDMCMLQGRGRNNPDYIDENPNIPGGVCNGITSGFSDEHDISFMPAPQNADEHENWRWAEQWLPHAAWLALAITAQATPN